MSFFAESNFIYIFNNIFFKYDEGKCSPTVNMHTREEDLF